MSSTKQDTNTNATRAVTEARSTDVVSTASYSADEQYNVKLIRELVNEAGPAAGVSKQSGTQEEKQAFGKLHQAFNLLFSLRGQAFLDAFGILISAMVKYKNGIFYPPTMNSYITNFSDRATREVFTIFINMARRFAMCSNKAAFPATNNVDRLISRVVDNDLKQLLAHAFLAA